MLRASLCGVLQRSYPVTILIPEKPRLRVAGRLKWTKTSLCSKIYVGTGPKNEDTIFTCTLPTARAWCGSNDNVKMVVPPPKGDLKTVALISTCSKNLVSYFSFRAPSQMNLAFDPSTLKKFLPLEAKKSSLPIF